MVESTDGKTLKGFVQENTVEGAKVYTDESKSYKGLPNLESVKHSVGEYVRGWLPPMAWKASGPY